MEEGLIYILCSGTYNLLMEEGLIYNLLMEEALIYNLLIEEGYI